jgi:hypothetical protein
MIGSISVFVFYFVIDPMHDSVGDDLDIVHTLFAYKSRRHEMAMALTSSHKFIADARLGIYANHPNKQLAAVTQHRGKTSARQD